MEISYYLSSLTDSDRVFQLIREHWAVENKLHYMLDMHFREDFATKRSKNCAQNMNIINKMNLTMIQMLKEKYKLSSTLRIRKKIARMKPSSIFQLDL